MESNSGASHTVNEPKILIDFLFESNSGAPHTVNDRTILIDNWLESNPGAPHTVTKQTLWLMFDWNSIMVHHIQ